MTDRIYQPANGQCVCEIHKEFERANGITVDQWYERNPHVTPWYMEKCAGCMPNNCCQAPTPTPEPQSQHETGGLHFASFAGGAATGAIAGATVAHVIDEALENKGHKTVCNPVEEPYYSSQEQRYEALTAGPAMPSGKQLLIMAGVVGTGFVALTVGAIVMAASWLIVVATGAGLAALAAMAMADYAFGVAENATRRTQQAKAQQNSTVISLTHQYAAVRLVDALNEHRAPAQLTDNLNNTIEFGKAKEEETVYVYAKRV